MNHTAKNFALQLGSLISLYISLTSISVLLFSVITLSFPDGADYFYMYETAASSIRFCVAMLIVFFPTYLVLTRNINRIRRQSTENYLTLTKWLIYLSLLVGGGVLLGDVVSIIYVFLEGDITIRFLLKALVLFVVIGSTFFYYLKDAQGYWQVHEKESMRFAVAATALVLIAVGLGFYHSDTPAEVRERKLDNRQIIDLKNIQWQIATYTSNHDTLPSSFADFSPIESAPDNRAAYRYEVTGEATYMLCAEFAYDSTNNHYSPTPAAVDKNYNWHFEAGDWCFERSVEKVE